jgi:hypothetical protein
MSLARRGFPPLPDDHDYSGEEMFVKKRYALLIFIAPVFLYSCFSQKTVPLSIPNTQTNTKIPVSVATLTKIATKTPPSAPKGLPLTWTPLATLSAAQSRKMVADLYENNPCELPCWWEITPGKTSWLEAWQFLGTFARNQQPWDTLLLESRDFPGYMYYTVLLDVPETQDQYYYSSLNDLTFIINIASFKVDYIDVNTGNIDDFTMRELLLNYGRPETVYARLGQSPVEQYSGATILLYYPQYGFVSTHFARVEEKEFNKNSEVTACFQEATNLYLWDQEDVMSIGERLKLSGFDDVGISSFKPINQISKYSVNEFYDFVVGHKQEPCLDLVY